MADSSRRQRVADQIQKELAGLIQREMKDPRLGMVTVSAVDVSRDLAYADVYITILGKNDDDERKQTLDILTRGGGFLRSKLARAMKLRIVPALRFRYDESIERGVYLSNLIEDARKKDQAYNTSPDSGEE
ncbi:MAG: 30S ribosome-binding factor RbfA [Gammaproteobacteria bacterium]|jgi:ribosome-binding factor A|nr:30S ribosome-binding factor RbfA [Gammaproteobacteria bacterium]